MMTKFSILIAHYNNFHYFQDCYKSILGQTFQEFEVVILDDCSTDDSFAQVKELVKTDQRFKVFQNEENRGVGYTKGKLIELATGDLCGFLDPDDAITPTALQDAIDVFSEKIVAVYSKIQICDKELKYKGLFPNQRQVKNANPYFFNIFFEANHFFVFRKSAYEKTEGINENLTSAVDQDLYLKLYETGDFKFISKPNYLYRIHEKGVSQEKSKKDKLNKNWHYVLLETLKRRKIIQLYGKNVAEIENLPKFIFEKENCKIINKIKGGVRKIQSLMVIIVKMITLKSQ
ncbi:MAG: glycosyltransferase family 2 protein [Bergeyella zoohelcum]|nr:glycosyltransferase family 2 protein [Bergeyella zoohelcum]